MFDWIKNFLLTIWEGILGLIVPWIQSTPVWQLILLGIGVVLGIVLIIVFWKIVRIIIGVLLTGGYLAGAVWLTMMLWRDGDVFWIFLLKEILVVGIYSALFIGLMKSLFEKPNDSDLDYSFLDRVLDSKDIPKNEETEEEKRAKRHPIKINDYADRYYNPTRHCGTCSHAVGSWCTYHEKLISDSESCSKYS